MPAGCSQPRSAPISIAYRFYSKFIAAKIFALDATRATPADRLADGRDFVPTNRWVVFGHHFAAIAGPGPLVGPDARRAVRLPARRSSGSSSAWRFGGAVQDFVILCASVRRDGKSLGEMAQGRDRPRRRLRRAGRRVRHHDHPDRGAGARRRERARRARGARSPSA